jgi:glutamate-1-semialdehyde 2,1-aminomutase
LLDSGGDLATASPGPEDALSKQHPLWNVQAVNFDEGKFLARFKARTPKSAELYRQALTVTPGGVMGGIKYFEPYPIFMNRADGSHIWDVDGNEYIDYLMSYGALILGHGERTVKSAVEATLNSFGTTVTGTPTEVELDYGATLRDIYHKDGLIRFTNSGLEATLLAVRLARGFTGKGKVAKFEGHYHGAVDRLLFSYMPGLDRAGHPQSPVPVADSIDFDEEMLAESLVLPFNDWKGTEELITRHSDELACIIMEPFEEGVIPGDPNFMASLRRLTEDLRIPLIYDEVKTGFRVRLGGASEFYSITPDITCLGKIIGGGLPIGAVVGNADIMRLLDPRSAEKGGVFHSGTFNGNPLSLHVGRATVRELRSRGRFEALVSRTGDLKRNLSSRLKEYQIPNTIAGEGAMFNIYLTDGPVRNYRDAKTSDARMRRFLDLEMISRGVYLKPGSRYSLSLAHTEEDVKKTGERFAESLGSVATAPAR